jgi:lauroyl/myristoyl acyltransferase
MSAAHQRYSSPVETPPHAPELGLARRLLGPFHVTGVFWYRFPYWGLRLLPAWAEAPVVLLFTTFFFFVLRKIRRAIATNLEAVLGPCGFWQRQVRIYRTMFDFAWCLTERYERMSRPERFKAVIEGEEHWKRLADAGEGAIFPTAHIGAWENASHVASQQVGRRVHLVREEEMDPKAQAQVNEALRRHGDPRLVTHFATDDPRLAVLLADALRHGDVVALQGDRPRSRGRHMTVTLFGRPMHVPTGPAALGRVSGAKLIPVFCFREGRFRTRVVLREPITVPRTDNREADIARATERLAAETEWAIRERPHQWFCFRQLWP